MAGTKKHRHAWGVILTICLISAPCRTGSNHKDGIVLQDYRRIKKTCFDYKVKRASSESQNQGATASSIRFSCGPFSP